MSRQLRDVVFVDGVRTPFGKAKGQYAETRADDLVIKCIRELHPAQPGAPAGEGRRGGDRGHHPDRRPGPDHRPDRRAAGRPPPVRARLRHRPHVRRRDDRGDHHRVGHRVRRLRRRHRRRRRAHGPAPDGRGRRPEPADHVREGRRPRGALDGQHRGEPPRPLPHHHQGAHRRLRRALAGEDRRGVRRRPDPARPGPGRDPLGRGRLGAGRRRRADAPGDHDGVAGRAEDAVPSARPGHRGQRRRHQRRRDRLPARRRGDRPRARPPGEDAAGRLLLRRRRARGDGRRADPVDREGAEAGRPDHRRHRRVRGQRGVRRAGARVPRALRHRRRRPARQPVRRRDRDGAPAGLLGRPPDDPARPPVRGAPRGPLRPDHHVRRHRHGRHRDLGEPALDRCQRRKVA